MLNINLKFILYGVALKIIAKYYESVTVSNDKLT